MVGVGAAKALAVALDKPLYAVNHLVGHVGADILDEVGNTVRLPDHRPARLRRAHLAAARARPRLRRRTPRRDHRRRGGGGVRQGRPGARACRTRAVRRSTGWRRRAIRRRSASRAGLTLPKDLVAPPLRLLLLRAEDGGRPLGREAAGPRERGAGGGCRCQLPRSGRRRARSPRRSPPASTTTCPGCCSAVASSPMPGCANSPPSGPRRPESPSAFRRCRCARTTAR